MQKRANSTRKKIKNVTDRAPKLWGMSRDRKYKQSFIFQNVQIFQFRHDNKDDSEKVVYKWHTSTKSQGQKGEKINSEILSQILKT